MNDVVTKGKGALGPADQRLVQEIRARRPRALARAIISEPKIVLADEPIASLDPENTRVVMDALQRINHHYGVTVVCNLHSIELARAYCDRLVGMSAGRVVFDDVPARLTDAAARGLYGTDENAARIASDPPFLGAAASIAAAT